MTSGEQPSWREDILAGITVLAMVILVVGFFLLCIYGLSVLAEWFWDAVICEAVVCK